MRSAAMRTRIDQFGLHVPTWVFYCGLDYTEETKVQKAVFERIAKHARQWLGQQREPEVLGQESGSCPGRLLTCTTSPGSARRSGSWPTTFTPALSTRRDMEGRRLRGTLPSTMMRVLLGAHHHLSGKSCPVRSTVRWHSDTVICVNGQECLHNMVVLVPIQLLVDYWLPPREADLLGGRFPQRQRACRCAGTFEHRLVADQLARRHHGRSEAGAKSNPACQVPFAPAAYRQQGYFNSFVVAYSHSTCCAKSRASRRL